MAIRTHATTVRRRLTQQNTVPHRHTVAPITATRKRSITVITVTTAIISIATPSNFSICCYGPNALEAAAQALGLWHMKRSFRNRNGRFFYFRQRSDRHTTRYAYFSADSKQTQSMSTVCIADSVPASAPKGIHVNTLNKYVLMPAVAARCATPGTDKTRCSDGRRTESR